MTNNNKTCLILNMIIESLSVSPCTMQLLRRLFSSNKPKRTPSSTTLKVINSHETFESKELVDEANAVRMKELKKYQKEMAKTRRSHAQFAESIPTRAEIESEQKRDRTERRTSTWTKYVDGLKKCWNPPVEELKAAGKIPVRDEARRAGKAERGRLNLMLATKYSVLMKRKYMNYLSTEVIPSLVTPENLEAKIQEALDEGDRTSWRSANLTAESVIEVEREIKRKLRGIRVSMDEYEIFKRSNVEVVVEVEEGESCCSNVTN